MTGGEISVLMCHQPAMLCSSLQVYGCVDALACAQAPSHTLHAGPLMGMFLPLQSGGAEGVEVGLGGCEGGAEGGEFDALGGGCGEEIVEST